MSAEMGDLAERMVDVALGMAVDVREDSLNLHKTYDDLGELERRALVVALAALVDIEQTPAKLLAWVTFDADGTPLVKPSRPKPPTVHNGKVWIAHGSHASFNRHKANGSAPCDACVMAERKYQRERGRRRRAVAA